MEEKTILKITKQIAQGIQYFHSKDIVHKNLKLVTIFFKMEGSKIKIKIGDFRIINENRNGKLFAAPYYLAPEMI